MKRLQVMLEEDLDVALGQRAAEEGVSKAALIRRYVRERVEPPPPIEDDPIRGMVGAYDGESGDVDEVVYG